MNFSAKGFLKSGKMWLALLVFFFFPGAIHLEALADIPPDLAQCSGIEDDAERLKCYDRLAGRRSDERAPALKSGEKVAQEKDNKTLSYFSRLWELEPETRVGTFPVKSYRSNYILPYTYNARPNYDAVRAADPGKDLKYEEAVFQLSFKIKLWSDILGQKADLWAAYTQRSFWLLYHFEESSPFRVTDYEPELLLNLRTDYRLFGLRGRFFHIGINHQSNGQSEPLSRSWNRIVAGAGLERGNFSLLVKGWYRILEDASDDENPEIEDYLGYGEVWGYYFWQGHRFGIMLRNNLAFRNNRGAVQLEWSFPLIKWVSGYAQYFNGFGESLLDYNHGVNRIGVGLILKEWD